MKTLVKLAGMAWLSLFLVTTASAQSGGSSPLSEEEQQLMEIESSVISVQLALSAARKRGDDPEEIEKLQKKFDKLQKKRRSLLQATWQM